MYFKEKFWAQRYGSSMNTEDAMSYFLDCILATVSSMAMKTKRPKHELQRQIRIAQNMVDYMIFNNLSAGNHDSIAEVYKDFGGSIEKWAESQFPEEKK